MALDELKSENFSSAIIKLKLALKLEPNNPKISNDLAIAYIRQKKYLSALDSLEKIIHLDFKPALINHFKLSSDLKLYNKSLLSINKLVGLNPDNLNYLTEKLKVLEKLNQLDEINNVINKILEITPKNFILMSRQLMLDQYFCKWNRKKLQELLIKNKNSIVFEPYSFLYFNDSEEIKFQVSKKWSEIKFSTSNNQFPINKNKKKISIGYFSANFKNHPTAYLIREVLDNHNLHDFDIHIFSYTFEREDDLHKEFKNKYKNFHDVYNQNPEAIANFSKSIPIDIAIDLDGFTKNNRMEIFFHRAASIQIRFLDYLGTTGTDFYEYLIADQYVIPKSSKKFYSEKIAYMPDCFFIRDTRFVTPINTYKKSFYGLPDDQFIFASFNISNKITEDIFLAWIEILKNTNNTCLWLLIEDTLTQENILKASEIAGIKKTRIFFAKRVTIHEHLSRHSLVDLFLDTTPYNGHSTSSDALWMNIPIITLEGRSFASRVTSSMLSSLNMDELIVNNIQEYINLAIHLSRNINKVEILKEKIKKAKVNSSLFDMKMYTINLEKIFKNALSDGSGHKKLNH